jgi:hypothetical protein
MSGETFPEMKKKNENWKRKGPERATARGTDKGSRAGNVNLRYPLLCLMYKKLET